MLRRMFSAAVSIASSATAIVTTVNDYEQVLQVHNNGSNTVFVGDAAVTTAAGFPIPSGEYRAFALRPGDALYGIVVAGTEEVRVLRRRD